MPNSLFLNLYYQVYEEILETGCWYYALDAQDPINVQDHEDLAREVSDACVTHVNTILGIPGRFVQVEVRVPKNGSGAGFGPFRFMVPCEAVSSSADGNAAMDAITTIVNLRGTRSDGKPVVGGLRLAGRHRSKYDCNVIDQLHLMQLTNSLDGVFKSEWQISSGARFVRSINHKPNTIDNEFVVATDLDVNPRITTRQDRRLNRSNRFIKPPEDNGPPDPT